MRIAIVIDDVSEVRRQLKRFVAALGLEVKQYGRAEYAIKALQKREFRRESVCLVVSDLYDAPLASAAFDTEATIKAVSKRIDVLARLHVLVPSARLLIFSLLPNLKRRKVIAPDQADNLVRLLREKCGMDADIIPKFKQQDDGISLFNKQLLSDAISEVIEGCAK